ncbi:ParM/StbA family protein [Paucibacter soli]|uniref:ParM/StbA family protein n=1 Tax=Paucibacter soli TaxID=3133433 RepID=UPI0030ACA2AB
MSKKTDTAAKAQGQIFVGCDDGNAATDLVIMDPGQAPRTFVMPSRARSGIQGTTVIGGDATEGSVIPCYDTAGVQFTVGDLADAESARFDDYPTSPMNRVIIHHALRTAGLGGKEVVIATGLPLGWYYKGGEPNQVLIDRKKQSLEVAVRAMDDSDTAIIVRHEVYPEGLAAWVDYAVDDKGNLRADPNETVAIIDIGGRTTDSAVVLPGRRIDHARCGSADIGVLDVVGDVAVALQARFGVDIPSAMVEKALRDRQIKVYGKMHDIGAEIDAAVGRGTDTVLREVSRRLGKSPDVDRFLLVGGGAYLFKDVAKSYPNVSIPAQPELANARGFAKFLSL